MDVIIWYVLFAVTTAATATYEISFPSMAEVCRRAPDSLAAQHKWLMTFVLFCLYLLGAPLIIFSCLVPSVSLRTQFALTESLIKD